jgi:hypothetical protein
MREGIHYFILCKNIKKIVFQKYYVKITRKKYSQEPVAIVYIARVTNEEEIELVDKFIKSLARYEVGANYKLYICFKDIKMKNLKIIRRILKETTYNEIFLPSGGYDIGSYSIIAKQISENKVIFFNTSTEVKKNNWLAKMMMNINKKYFIIGGSGSFETLSPVIQNHPIFPNPHIRTNGFLIDREFFLNITKEIEIKNKEEAWNIESGRNSLSAKIFKIDGQVCVVDKFGIGYDFERWPVSKTFRSSNQKNILFSDNRVREYANSESNYKNLLYLNTWGDRIWQ